MEDKAAPIYIISGGVGASGEQLVQTVLAQFPDSRVQVHLTPHVRQMDQIEAVIEQARQDGGTLVHTLVDTRLRTRLIQAAQSAGVPAIDLMGPLIERLSDVLQQPPAEHPGLYRKLNRAYYERVAAIEYTMAHDDGKSPDGWQQAEIFMLGVSRSGKTPISLYLSVLGWKVANLPLVAGIEPHPELFNLGHERVVGLYIDAGQLLLHRRARQSRLGAPGPSAYVDPASVYEEVEAARQFFQRHGFLQVDVTDKPIETCADEIIRLVARNEPTRQPER